MFSINTDAAAAVALNRLQDSEAALRQTQDRVSTGLKIIGANDDASDFAIAQGVRGDLLGRQAMSELQAQIKGVLAVTNAATTNVSNILTDMKTLAVKASSGTNSATQLSEMQAHFAALRTELDAVVQGATYNGVNLLYAVPPGPSVGESMSITTTDTNHLGKAQAGDAVTMSFIAQNSSGGTATDPYTATVTVTRTDNLSGGGTTTTTVGTQTIATQQIAAGSSVLLNFTDTLPAGVTSSTYQMAVTSTNGVGTVNATSSSTSTSQTDVMGTRFVVRGHTPLGGSTTINGPPTGGAAVLATAAVDATDTLDVGIIQPGDSAVAYVQEQNVVATQAPTAPVSATLTGTQSVDGGAPTAISATSIPSQTLPNPGVASAASPSVTSLPAAATSVTYNLTAVTSYNGTNTTISPTATFTIGAPHTIPGFNPTSGSNTVTEVVQPLNVLNAINGSSIIQINRSNLTSSNLGLSGLNLTTNAVAALQQVDTAMTQVGVTAGYYGEQAQQLDQLDTFYSAISDAVKTGLGAAVDANLGREAAKLTAEQVRQQFSAQMLPIANSQLRVVGALFRNGAA